MAGLAAIWVCGVMARDRHSFMVCGGCHFDRQFHLHDGPLMGRTNPASQQVRTGGVAANIARHLAVRGADVGFVGVQPPAELTLMEAQLRAEGVRPNLLPLAGEVPGYTAILSPAGDLLVGAAAMALYDEVTAELLMPPLGGSDAPLVLDANFPGQVLQTVVESLDDSRRLFATATSAAKVGRLAGCLGRFDALVLNRGEAAVLAGDGSVAEMAGALAGRVRPGGYVLVSDGPGEAALATGGDCVTASPPPVRLVNANGAGDAMAAALFWGLADVAGTGLATRLDHALSAGADFAAGTLAEPSR